MYFTNNYLTQALESLGITLNFVEDCIKYFGTNYTNKNTTYYDKMRDLFKTTSQTLPEENLKTTKNKSNQNEGCRRYLLP